MKASEFEKYTLRMCCSVVWSAVKACHAYGAPSSHGCKLDPGHEGDHRCPCGARLTAIVLPTSDLDSH